MKLFKILASIFTTYAGIRFVQSILNKYSVGIYYVDKEEDKALNEEEQKRLEEENSVTPKRSIDLRGTPTHQCVCGNEVWNLQVVFDDYEIATYYLDMECVQCGSVATAPTPVDREV